MAKPDIKRTEPMNFVKDIAEANNEDLFQLDLKIDALFDKDFFTSKPFLNVGHQASITSKTGMEKDEFLTNSLINRLLKQKGFIQKEDWQDVQLLSAKVLSFNKEYITLECLISKERNIFETRRFKRSLFDHIDSFTENSFFKIKISEKPGSARIDIIDGTGLGLERDFHSSDLWNELENVKLDEPELKNVKD